MSTRGKLPLRDLVVLSLLGALIVASKQLMSFLPNIEPVTLLLICTARVYGLKALYPCAVFVLLQGLLYGVGMWFVNYLYVWPLLVVLVWLLRRCTSRLLWVAVAALYGLLFGTLCAIPYLFLGGWAMAFSYWVAGIPFDLIHCVGNAALNGLLQEPLTKLLAKLTAPKT